MDTEQRLDAIEKSLRDLEKTCAVKQADLKNTIQKVDETRELVKTIHQLTINVGELTSQVKIQGEKIETVVVNCDTRLKEQGKRIGELENQGAKRWEAIMMQVISLSVAAGVGTLLAKI